MRLPRLSVGTLMVFVAIVALNVAVARVEDGWSMAAVGDLGGVLSMGGTLAILLSVLALRLSRSGETGGFLFGFQVFGWAAVLACLAGILFAPRWVAAYSNATLFPIWNAVGPSRTIVSMPGSTDITIMIEADDWPGELLYKLGVPLVFAAPGYFLATLGGWMFQTLGINVVAQARSRWGRGINIMEGRG